MGQKIIIVSGKCPKCGYVAVGRLARPKDKFRALCKKHGRQDFIILSSALRDKDEADAVLKGEVI